ncbi:HAD-IA family hydrolase [Treponema bryantii]|uniref:HAD-IA family hydrolase n=1 Tax=Treponema bryantii TaxID=163 RepID=UPI0003B5FC5F|nr:HAD-IA family hydrolase [Treponema bryantii]
MNSFILFDFDGTIADTISAGLEIINSHAEKYGYKKLDGDINTHFSALQLVKMAEVKLWKLPYLIYQLKKKLSERSDELKVLPEAPELIKKLSNEGYELGILTSNSLKTVKSFLKKYQLDSFFSFLRTDVSLFGKKKALAKAKKVINKKIVYIGDELRDIEACRKNDIPIVSVPWGLNSYESLEEHNPGLVAKTADEAYNLLINL